MINEELQFKIQAYLDDSLSEAELAAFQKQLDTDAALQQEVELFRDFAEFLEDEYVAGRRTLLIVDEAQNLDDRTLEEIRLLTNVNADDRTYLQLLLVGQPELHDKLKQNNYRI